MPMATPNPITTNIPELIKAYVVIFEIGHNNEEFWIYILQR